jgi:hypothetical protein
VIFVDFSQKSAAIYSAKLDIREAIKTKGVAVPNSEPFGNYAAKILLIEGSGGGGGTEDGSKTSGFSVTNTLFTLTWVPRTEYAATENFLFDFVVSDDANDTALILYPPTHSFAQSENFDYDDVSPLSPTENIVLEFMLFAFAERFNLTTAGRYAYDFE